MHQLNNIWLLLFVFVIPSGIFAQTSDTIQLETVLLESSRSMTYSKGRRSVLIDSSDLALHRHEKLGELLRHNGMYLTSYGPGLLQSPAARGLGSGHTAILWNGFNLQSNTNGVLDLSLVPAAFFDQVRLDYGGGGALFGNAAVGSTINLTSTVNDQKGFNGNYGFDEGSFGRTQQNGKLAWSNKKIRTSLRFFEVKADNDFPYTYKQQDKRQINAKLHQWGFHQDNQFQLGSQQHLKTFWWYQNSEREIPPTAVENNTLAFQSDRFLRAGLSWHLLRGAVNYTARTAMLDEHLLFYSNVVDSSMSHTQALISEAEATIYFKSNHQLNIGFHHTFDRAEANAFEENPTRHRLALYANWKIRRWQDRLVLVAGLRQEMMDRQWVPLMPSLAMEWQIHPRWQIKTSVAGIYKIPNFNDLYWPAVGNRDLLPEAGWSTDLGLTWKPKRPSVELSLTAFSNWVDNWILWAPEGTIWRPSNQRSVWSRGGELSLQGKINMGAFQLHHRWGYQFTQSTISSVNTPREERNVGKQLIYMPEHRAQATFRLHYANSQLTYFHQYTGLRYTTVDNAENIPAFQLGDLAIGQTFAYDDVSLNVGLRVNNLWNKDYTVLPARVMPRRHFRIEVSLGF